MRVLAMSTSPHSRFRHHAAKACARVLGMILGCTALLHADEKPAITQPPRQEVWVPSTDLEAILKKHPNAVLLDRAQYEALLRDAGVVKVEEGEPEVPSAIAGVKLRVDLTGGAQTAAITAKLSIHGLADDWSEVKLLELPPGVVLTKFDGDNVSPAADEKNKRALRLMVRGKGRHEITMQFRSPISRTKGVCRALVPYLARPFSVTVAPSNGVVLPSTWAVKDGVAQVPLFDERMDAVGTTFYWLERAADGAAPATLLQRMDSLAQVRANEIETFHRVTVEYSQGPLPGRLRFQLGDASVQVTRVDWWGKGDPPKSLGSESAPTLGGEQGVAEWKQDGTVLELVRRDSFTTQADFYFVTTKPTPLVTQTTVLPLDVPRLEGAAHLALNVCLAFSEGLEMVGWKTPGTVPVDAFLNFEKAQREEGRTGITHFHQHYASAPAQVAVDIRRARDLYSADVDLYALITQHDLQLTRMVVFRGEEGGVRRAVFSLPQGEQFLGLEHAAGEPIRWKQVEGTTPAIEVTWPRVLAKGSTSNVQLKTRKELPAGADAPLAANAAAPSLALQNLIMPESTRLAGYIALDFDESWRIATPDTTGLESRDARYTPVKGRMAWFYLRDFRLGIELSRHEPVLDAAISAYALPRNRTVEIEGQLAVEVTRAPLRTFTVKLPTSVASLMRWDSPLIGERQLDGATGTWTLKLRKELLGVASLRWHLSQPGETQDAAAAGASPDQAGEKPQAASLTAVLPRIEMPNARHFTGTWIIEANTDTELSFATKGVQPLDAVRAPGVEGYQPRHRVLAAYVYGNAPHELRVTATRHETTRLTSAVVEALTLTSVLARDGTMRHEAVMRVRHSGDQFFAIRLPAGATLLTTSVEHSLIKPVTAGPGEVRVPLPRQQSGNNLALVSVLYETTGGAWSGGGSAALVPPAFDEGVPVLTTTWRVHAPDGYSYTEPDTTLSGIHRGSETPPLASALGNTTLGVLQRLDFPMSGAQYEYAQVRATGVLGVNEVDFLPGGASLSQARPGEEQMERNRATGLYQRSLKVPSNFLDLVPPQGTPRDPFAPTPPVPATGAGRTARDVLMAHGIAFQNGAEATYVPETSILLVEGTQPMIEQVEMLVANWIPKDDDALVDMPIQVSTGSSSYFAQRMKSIIFPRVQFQGASVEEAVEFLRIKSRDYDATESDPTKKGMSMVIKPGSAPNNAKITVDLKDVTMDEALRHITELAGMKYKIEPHAVVIVSVSDAGAELYVRTFKVPPDFHTWLAGQAPVRTRPSASVRFPGLEALAQRGITFPEGTTASFVPATSQLIVKNTTAQLDQIELLVEDSWKGYAQRRPSKAKAKSGVLPVKLELPVTGRVFEFSGHQKPREIALHYQSWERQMAKACVWMLLGLAAFVRWGRRRPWGSTLAMAILLTCLPLALLPTWLAACNALLAGWLLGLVIWLLSRVAGWVELKDAERRAHA